MLETLTEVLAAHRPYGLDCKCGAPINSDGWWVAHVLEAVAAAGLAVVELPDQMADRDEVVPEVPEVLRGLPMWLAGDAWTCLRKPDVIEFEADRQTVYGELPVSAAEHLAAALLAAAGHAESAVFSE